MIDSILKVVRGVVKVRGATDGTLIGNVGDTLKTTATSVNDDFSWIQQGKLFSSNTTLTSIAGTTETDLYLFKNPAASGKIALITRISLGFDTATSRSLFRYYVQPTITADGTGLTENNLYLGHATSAVVTTFRSPTISARGALGGQFIKNNGTDSSILIGPIAIVPAGVNILGTIQNSSGNVDSFISVTWVEL